MKISTERADKLAIGLSSLCVIHCFATPLLLVLIPAGALASFDLESFHFWMVIAVIPTSIYAIALGSKKHKQLYVALFAVVGLATLICSVILGEHYLGEIGEKLVTTIGGVIVAYSHYKNFILCKNLNLQPTNSNV